MSRPAASSRPGSTRQLLTCLSLLTAVAGGCKNGQKTSAPSSPAEVGAASVSVPAAGRSVTFQVEVVRTEAQREQGLMYREHLAADAGMLFIFEQQAFLTFWMKNTFIPLDMLFIDNNRKIVGIVENAEPRTLTPRGVREPARFVLEINGGLSAKLGIKPGGVVDFRGGAVP